MKIEVAIKEYPAQRIRSYKCPECPYEASTVQAIKDHYALQHLQVELVGSGTPAKPGKAK